MSIIKTAVVRAFHYFQSILIFRLCLSTFLCIVSCVGTPLLFLLWIPSKIYKVFVITFVKVFYFDLRPISNSKNIIVADDDVYHNPANCSIVTVATIDGYLSLTEITQLFEENVIHTCIQDKQLRYPELQEYPVSFLGYPFLKKESEFNPNDHISEYHEEGISFSETEIHQIMLNRPFQNFKSPWELVIFRNVEKTKSILALSIHHFLCDGRSVVKLFVEGLGKQKLNVNDAKFKKWNSKEQAHYLLLMPFELIKMNIYLMKLELKFFGHMWRHQTFPQNRSPLFVNISPKIEMSVVKTIAKVAGVQTTSVIISAVVGAIERYFEARKGVYGFSPKTLPIYLTLPKECHPPTFSNHLHFGIPEASLTSKNEAKRLEMSDKMYKNMRQSDHSRYFDVLVRLFADYPKILRAPLTILRGVPTGVSNIAGEQKGFSVGGFPCVDFNLSAGVVQGSIGISFTIVSYKKHLQLSVVANGSVLSREETLFMGSLVENQLTTLSKTLLSQKIEPL